MKIIVDLANVPPIPIPLGKDEQNEFDAVVFDARTWGADYPGATYTVLYQRPDGNIYPVLVNQTGPMIEWKPTAADTTITDAIGDGHARAEVRLMLGDVLGKSRTVQFSFDASILSEAPDAPQPDWATQAAENAAKAEAAVSHYPQIRDGYWWMWDVASGEWVNTGDSANGLPGKSAYQIAVENGYAGTEAEWLASLKGAPGGPGTPGVSPTVTTEPIPGGHRITFTDAEHPQGQSIDVMNGRDGGVTEAVKQALLDCFENVAWINDQGQTYYDALYAALYPPKTVISISAAFNQGSAVIYDTDTLDTLKQYLVVTATYDDQTTQTVTNYTLSGTLTLGTSTITVNYGGKTDTFNATVSAGLLPSGYTKINGVHGNGSAYVKTNVQVPLGYSVKVKARAYAAPTGGASVVAGADRRHPVTGNTAYVAFCSLSTSTNWIGAWYGSVDNFFTLSNLYDSAVETTTLFNSNGSTFSAENADGSNSGTVSFTTSTKPSNALHLCLFYSGDSSGYKFSGDIIGVEVLDESNNTSETFIPAKRNSDNVVGFYAVTEGVFYSSDTSTPFTAVP